MPSPVVFIARPDADAAVVEILPVDVTVRVSEPSTVLPPFVEVADELIVKSAACKGAEIDAREHERHSNHL